MRHVEFSKLSERCSEREADGIPREERRDWHRGEMGPGGSGHLPGVGACGSEILLGMGAFSVALDVEISKLDCVLAQSCPVPGGGRFLEKACWVCQPKMIISGARATRSALPSLLGFLSS